MGALPLLVYAVCLGGGFLLGAAGLKLIERFLGDRRFSGVLAVSSLVLGVAAGIFALVHVVHPGGSLKELALSPAGTLYAVVHVSGGRTGSVEGITAVRTGDGVVTGDRTTDGKGHYKALLGILGDGSLGYATTREPVAADPATLAPRAVGSAFTARCDGAFGLAAGTTRRVTSSSYGVTCLFADGTSKKLPLAGALLRGRLPSFEPPGAVDLRAPGGVVRLIGATLLLESSALVVTSVDEVDAEDTRALRVFVAPGTSWQHRLRDLGLAGASPEATVVDGGRVYIAWRGLPPEMGPLARRFHGLVGNAWLFVTAIRLADGHLDWTATL